MKYDSRVTFRRDDSRKGLPCLLAYVDTVDPALTGELPPNSVQGLVGDYSLLLLGISDHSVDA